MQHNCVKSISSYINKFDVLENRIKFHVVGKQMMKILIQPLMVLLMLYICFTDSFESSIERYFGCLYSHVCSNKRTIYMLRTPCTIYRFT